MLLFITSMSYSEELKRFGGGSSAIAATNKTQFLKAEEAFTLQYEQKGQELVLNFNIAPNYYLYKERFKFQVENGNTILGQAFFNQEPDWKDDAEFGRVQVFHQNLTVTMPVKGTGSILVRWQGCADAGLCYAPQEQTILLAEANVNQSALINSNIANRESVSIPIPTLIPLVSYDVVEEPSISDDENQVIEINNSNTPKLITKNTATLIFPTTTTESSNPSDELATSPTPNNFRLPNNPILAILTLYVLGLGLAFTPCVLPMLPIVANIVARQHANNARQGFFLAFSYAVGVASSYGLLGILVSLFGSQFNLSAWLQHPTILISFSILFIILALASFDIFHLQLPQSWQHRLDQLSKTGKAGSFIGTWLTGFFSALVVSPCVSAPLAGVLLSVSTLGNPLMGGIALFMLGLGLSTPLMILAASEGKFMPKAGLWLNRVKQTFGVLLLAVAVALLSRVITDASMLFLWAALCVGSGFWINQWGGKWRVVWRSIAYMLLIWGATLLVGAALGSNDPVKPLAIIKNNTVANFSSPSTEKHTIHSVDELQQYVAQAKQENKILLVDFYADWCVSCKIMEREIFNQADVQNQLQNWLIVKADVTQNSATERMLQQQLAVFGPPALVFFKDGQEVSRLVGEVSKTQFLEHISSM